MVPVSKSRSLTPLVIRLELIEPGFTSAPLSVPSTTFSEATASFSSSLPPTESAAISESDAALSASAPESTASSASSLAVTELLAIAAAVTEASARCLAFTASGAMWRLFTLLSARPAAYAVPIERARTTARVDITLA